MVDPEMMSSMPKGLTAATGMDALTHAIEGYITKGSLGDHRYAPSESNRDYLHLSPWMLVSNTPEGRTQVWRWDSILQVWDFPM